MQIDRLGNRLRESSVSESDLRLLDEYRRSFIEAYEIVVSKLREELALEPTGRPAKSTTSVVEKLRRESIRLTQVQDIAGCRITVTDFAEQERVVHSLGRLFRSAVVVDRRESSSHGYRAVHVVVNCDDKLIEIQVRTALQHRWAELSEKLSDVVNPAIKYGGGNERVRQALTSFSEDIATVEALEKQVADILNEPAKLPEILRPELASLQQEVNSLRSHMVVMLEKMISKVNK